MIDGDQRFVEREGKRFSKADADEQCSGETRSLRDRDGVDRLIGMGSIGERLANDGNDGAEMLARSEFGNDTSVGLMSGDLRGDDVGKNLLARAHHGGSGFITGAFDTEDNGVGHN